MVRSARAQRDDYLDYFKNAQLATIAQRHDDR
jgi:hypothetical protein